MSESENALLSLLDNDLSLRWMITMLHFLWQGTLIGVSAAILARLLQNASALLRYTLYGTAMLTLLVCVAVTFAIVDLPEALSHPTAVVASVDGSTLHSTVHNSALVAEQSTFNPSLTAPFPLPEPPVETPVVNEPVLASPRSSTSQPFLLVDLVRMAPWISTAYLCGVVCCLMRLGIALSGGYRLRTASQPLANSALLECVHEQAKRIGLRVVPVVGYCKSVAVPTVMGVLRPMILLPTSIMTGLSPHELSAVLSHELAHIQRYDLWMNLMQRVIESLLFFHPAVWFISRRLSAEREICCDDLVLRSGHTRMNYAGALLRMAELCVSANQSQLATLAAAGHSPAELERRIELLMNINRKASFRLTRAGVVLLLGSLLIGVVTPAVLVAVAQSNANEQSLPAESSPTVPTDFDLTTGKNVRWRVPLGSVTMRAPLVHGDQIYVGTNNSHAYLPRFPKNVDLGVLLCFQKSDGKFLWQHSNEKLPTGRAHDWPMQGVTSRPFVDGDRLWYITNRGELVCLDTDGFHDSENDGPVQDEQSTQANDADVVWRYDMMAELGVRPHNISTCTVAVWKDRVFAVTGNGISESHQAGVADAPSFIAVDKQNGKLLWSDNSPGQNVLHGQWGSPVVAELAGKTQVIFPGGDGWLYSFDPLGIGDGKSTMIWKFDCNPKESLWEIGGRGTRNDLLHAPTVDKGLLYIAMGQDPEHGAGPGRVWCIDPSGSDDVSPELVFNNSNPDAPIPHRRDQACVAEKGDFTRPNPNSKAVWQFTGQDVDGDGKLTIEETMSRSLSTISIKDDLLFVSDCDGILHCLDRRTGAQHWGFDLLANVYATPMIAGQHVYVGNEDGDLSIFGCSADPNVAFPNGAPLNLINVNTSINASTIFDDNVMYVVTRSELIAIGETPETEQRIELGESRRNNDASAVAKESDAKGVAEPEIRYPYCIVETENLPERTLADAIAQFNQTSLESPIGFWQPPITEQETRDAIEKFVGEPHVVESVRTLLNEILKSGKLPPSVYFRRFTRFDDERQMRGVWWVRLCVEGEAPPLSSVPIRTKDLSSRPYTQLERRQNAEDGVTLINRFSSYYEDAPNILLLADFPDDKEARLIDRARAAITGNDFAAFESLFDWKGVSDSIRAFVKTEFQTLSESTIHSIKIAPRNFRGELIHWSAYQHYQPNLSVVGYLDIEYSPVGDQRAKKMLSLEMGDSGDDFRLVNYIELGEREFPKGKIDGLSIRGHIEQLADETFLVTSIITNPGTLISAHLANEEIWQRDYNESAGTLESDRTRKTENPGRSGVGNQHEATGSLSGRIVLSAPIPKVPPIKSTKSLKAVRNRVRDLGGTMEVREGNDDSEEVRLTLMSENEFASDDDLQLFATLANLTRLEFRADDITSQGIAQISQMTNLANLHLWNSRLGDDGLAKLTSLKRLQWLALYNCPNVTDHASEHLRQLPMLHSLNLYGTPITESFLRAMQGPQIRFLDLRRTGVATKDLSVIEKFPNLRQINLPDDVTDANLSHLSGLSELEILTLQDLNITDAGLLHLKALSKVEKLYLKNTHITDAGLANVITMQNLDTLDLSNTQISSTGLSQLATLPKLRTFVLQRTKIDDNALRLLSQFPRLQFLDVRDTNTTEAAVTSLRNASPKMKIQWSQ